MTKESICLIESLNVNRINNLNVLDDMYHFLYDCLNFNILRDSLIIQNLKSPCNGDECYKNLIIFNSKGIIDNLCNYLIRAIKNFLTEN